MVASNLPFGRWRDIFSDDVVAVGPGSVVNCRSRAVLVGSERK
jgi:hypothetical protein